MIINFLVINLFIISKLFVSNIEKMFHSLIKIFKNVNVNIKVDIKIYTNIHICNVKNIVCPESMNLRSARNIEKI